MSALRVVRAAAALQIRHLAVNLFMLFGIFVQPLFVAVTAMYMLRHRGDFDPIYVVVGAGLSGVWTVALFEGNWMIQDERWKGTLELVVAAPASLLLVVAGRLVGSMLFSLLSMLTCYAIGAWLFGYEILVDEPIGFAVALAFGLLSFWSIGVLLAPIGILWRTASRFLGTAEYPVYTLAGFLFPIALLPGWITPLSYALPPYWAAVALHGTSSGGISPGGFALALGLLVASSLGAVALARVLLGVVLARARRDGTLALT